MKFVTLFVWAKYGHITVIYGHNMSRNVNHAHIQPYMATYGRNVYLILNFRRGACTLQVLPELNSARPGSKTLHIPYGVSVASGDGSSRCPRTLIFGMLPPKWLLNENSLRAYRILKTGRFCHTLACQGCSSWTQLPAHMRQLVVYRTCLTLGSMQLGKPQICDL